MLWRTLLPALFFCCALALPAGAQVEAALVARNRVFPEVGPGVRALKRRPESRPSGGPAVPVYYILTAPGPGVLLYDAGGQRVGQVPGPGSKEAALVYGDDLDVDAQGRVYVADLGANAAKVFNPDGTLALTIPIAAPISVLVLAEGELAVASMKSPRLVTVFGARGKVVREFGEPAEMTDRNDLNRFLNSGRLASDAADHIYYAFDYLPEPTVRKYDRNGYAALEVTLTVLEFQPAAQAARREIQRQQHGSSAPALKPIITALGVDPATQEIWVALGGVLLHFDREGNRRGTYRTFTPEGARVEAVAILVEPDRLLLASDPLGIYEFTRPDKPGH